MTVSEKYAIPIDMGNHKILNVAAGSDESDVVIVGQIPAIFMPQPTGTAATDRTNIQSVINMSAVGSTIAFWAGETAYETDERIVFLGDRKYVGMGIATSGYAATIKQADGTNLGSGLTGEAFDALFASDVWANGTGESLTCDNPVIIENLCFDVNADNNVSSVCVGIAMINYWSIVRGNQIQNTRGEAGHGLVLTDTAYSGAVITNSASQNRVVGNQFVNIDADGVRQICANNIANLDGFCTANIFNVIGGNGISFDSAAGWKIDKNHAYGITLNGIDVAKAFATSVLDNYIEDFGGQAASEGYYAGIFLGQLDGRGSFIKGNFVSCAESSSGVGAYQYISLMADNDESDAQVTVIGNQIHGPDSPTTQGIGLTYQVGSGGAALSVIEADNMVLSVHTDSYVADGVTFLADAANPALIGTYPGGTTDFLRADGTWAAPPGGGGGSGTVTAVSVATANGFAGTVATDTTTPVITIKTGVTGLLKGNGTAVSAGTAGTDYVAPTGSGASLTGITASQVGAIALSLATAVGDTIYGSASGVWTKIAGNTTATKKFWTQTGTGSASAAPGWNALVSGDIPNNAANTTGTAANLAGAATFPAAVSPTVIALTDGSSIATNAALGNEFTATLGGNRTMAAPSSPTNGQKITYEIVQDATGSRTLTWTSGTGGFSFGSGTAPVLTTAAHAVDFVTFRYSSKAANGAGMWVYYGSMPGY